MKSSLVEMNPKIFKCCTLKRLCGLAILHWLLKFFLISCSSCTVFERLKGSNSNNHPNTIVWYCVLCTLCIWHNTFLSWHYCWTVGALCIILILMCDYLFGNIYNRRCLSTVEIKVLRLCFYYRRKISSIVSVNQLFFFSTKHLKI